MDSVVFLGGRESSTIKEISGELAGKGHHLHADRGPLPGQSESYNQNTQRLGRELMTPSELATMPGDQCILQLRGLPPFFSPKYDLKQHPNYKYTAEADKRKTPFTSISSSTAAGGLGSLRLARCTEAVPDRAHRRGRGHPQL